MKIQRQFNKQSAALVRVTKADVKHVHSSEGGIIAGFYQPYPNDGTSISMFMTPRQAMDLAEMLFRAAGQALDRDTPMNGRLNEAPLNSWKGDE